MTDRGLGWIPVDDDVPVWGTNFTYDPLPGFNLGVGWIPESELFDPGEVVIPEVRFRIRRGTEWVDVA